MLYQGSCNVEQSSNNVKLIHGAAMLSRAATTWNWYRELQCWAEQQQRETDTGSCNVEQSSNNMKLILMTVHLKQGTGFCFHHLKGDIVTTDGEKWMKLRKCPCKGHHVESFQKDLCQNLANYGHNNAISQGNMDFICWHVYLDDWEHS